MKRINVSKILLVYALILLFAVTGVMAQEQPVEPNKQASSGLSGKVVDTEGKSIVGFTFMIQSMQNMNGHLQPIVVRAPIIRGHIHQVPIDGAPIVVQEQLEGKNQPDMPRSMAQVKTDTEGNFKVTNLKPGPIQIMAIPKEMLNANKKIDPNIPQELQRIPMELMIGRHRHEGEMQIISIRLNKITFFYPEMWGPVESLVFGLKPDVTLEDVKITAKQRLKIRAQIIYADGTPLANDRARLSMRYRGGEFGSNSGTHGTSCSTDAEGYFTQYRDVSGYYTLSITYKNFSGGAGPFLLKKGTHPEKLVIKLDGNPVAAKRPNGEKKELNKAKARVIVKGLLDIGEVQKPIIKPPEKIVWVINPTNGHAYAKIQCQDWHDAQQKAIKEGAHLVSINTEEEQFWIDVIFGRASFWIGLNDVEKESEWRWDSGEPVTYTNWSNRSIFPDNAPDTEKDFVAISLHDTGWESVSPKGHLGRTTRNAVIEKDGLVSKIPVAAESEDE